MRLVKLTNIVSVNPECVAAVVVNTNTDNITVRMDDSKEYHISNDYGKSVWETHERVMKELQGLE